MVRPVDTEAKRYIRMTLGDLQEWFVLYGNCFKCDHVGYIDRYRLVHRFGAKQRMKPLEAKLFCKRCGNRHFNGFAVAPMQR
ncbi:hypothetical protein [Ensifer sp. ENS08]|uniref:hypothetical protein n=1 Tax=Ensifer sp. ENS08 TaxID=2769273 RepID=UPI00177C3F82|nr:hypothetical protein [Ensifer sp. ENS08]MBD9573429.1 hypothetical protein [Ensifer sp. ENS08]